MRPWRLGEAERLVRSELAESLAETWARCGDEECLAKSPFEPELVGAGRWWLGPFTIGNRKMGEIPFYSLPPLLTCPGHTPFCTRWCYAVYEIVNWRAHVREAAAYLVSLRDDFPDIAARYLAKLPHPVVRLHVSGDFYDRRYLEKWAEVARRLPHKIFYTYTKSFDVIRNVETPRNLVIHLSADPYNYVKAAETWREIRRGLITFVYMPPFSSLAAPGGSGSRRARGAPGGACGGVATRPFSRPPGGGPAPGVGGCNTSCLCFLRGFK